MKEKELLADHFADSAVAELHEADTAGTLTNLTTVEGVIGDVFDGRGGSRYVEAGIVDELYVDCVSLATNGCFELSHHLTAFAFNGAVVLNSGLTVS